MIFEFSETERGILYTDHVDIAASPSAYWTILPYRMDRAAPLHFTCIIMAMGKRFCFLCCVMIISSACQRTSGVNYSADEAVQVAAKMRGTTDLNAAYFDLNDLDFYTANCELKSSRKRWLNSMFCGQNINEKSWFTNPSGFIQGLVLLFCFAWCVLISGIAFATLSLCQLHYCGVSHRVPVKDIIYVTKQFIVFSECGIFTPIKCNLEISRQDWIRHNSHDSESKCHIHMYSISISRVIILMLLLISGDVELNPGPKERNADSSQPRSPAQLDDPKMPEQGNLHNMQPDNVQQFPSVNKTPILMTPSDSVSLPVDSLMPPIERLRIVDTSSREENPAKAVSMVIPADLNSAQSGVDPNSTEGIADQRKIQISSPDETNNNRDDVKRFEKQQDALIPDDVERTDLDPVAHDQPKEQTKVLKYVVFTPTSHHMKYATTEDSEGLSGLQETSLREAPLQETLLQETPLQGASGPLQEAPDFSEVEHCYLTKEEWATCLNKELDSEYPKFKDSFAKRELDDCTMSFFSCANRLHRAGCLCHYCSICGSNKRNDTRGSHIFPEGLLKVFRRIHCYNAMSDSAAVSKHEAVPKEHTEFIYDFVLNKRIGTSAWTYDLLCGSCEQKCSAAEGKLHKVYIHMMSSDTVLPLAFSNENIWFHYILAMIMFRGLLVNEKLHFTESDTRFRRRFTELWNFCKSDPESFKDDDPIPNLRLFCYLIGQSMKK